MLNVEIGVNSITDDVQSAPDVAFLDNNRVVVAWRTEVGTNTHGDGSDSAIKFTIYGIGGLTVLTLLGERLANTSVAGGQFNPEVVALKNGNFVIAWTDNSGTGLDGSLASIRLQAFNSVGEKIGGEITVNTTTTGNQEDVSLTALADGRVVVTWTDYSDTTGDIRAQIVDPRDGIVDGTSAADTLYGHDAIGDIISGGAGGDMLFGLDGSDSLYGGQGSDNLDGGLGVDYMDGGADPDFYNVDNAGDVIVERVFDGGFDEVLAFVSYVLKAGVEVEFMSAASTAGAINLTGNAFGQTLSGNAFNNILDGGVDTAQDSLGGFAGNDTYIIRSGNDLITESAGQGTADRVRTTVSIALAGDDNIEFLETLVPTGVGGINLTGNSLAQTITGNAGVNVLDGGVDALKDTLVGLGGNDIHIIRSALDVIVESAGQGTADRARVTTSFTLAADDNIEFLETLVPTGVGGINLTGNSLAQTITGNNAANTIRGMGGIDTLRGNLGNDTFHYALNSEGNDKLLDFSSNAVGNNDRFTFLNANFNNVGLGVLQAAEFQSDVSNVALGAGVRFFYETDTRILRFDSNGSGLGGATVIATLQVGATFVIGDILIV